MMNGIANRMRSAKCSETVNPRGAVQRRFWFPALILGVIVVAPQVGCGWWRASDELEIQTEKGQEVQDLRFGDDPGAERLRSLVFNGLTRQDEHLATVPDLATNFEADPGFRKFTFRLRSGVRFHNDRVLSSLDVRYTFVTMMSEDSRPGRGGLFRRLIESIVVPDARTVVFNIREPFPDFARAVSGVGIIAEDTAREQRTNPIGTGPYRFVGYDGRQTLRLRRNNDYFGAQR